MARGGARPGSGRPKGSGDTNYESKKQKMLNHIQSHELTKDFDPIIALAICAKGQVLDTYNAFDKINKLLSGRHTKKNVDEVHAIVKTMLKVPVFSQDHIISAAKEVAQYTYPKLRAIEISDPQGNNPFAAFATALAEKVKK